MVAIPTNKKDLWSAFCPPIDCADEHANKEEKEEDTEKNICNSSVRNRSLCEFVIKLDAFDLNYINWWQSYVFLIFFSYGEVFAFFIVARCGFF